MPFKDRKPYKTQNHHMYIALQGHATVQLDIVQSLQLHLHLQIASPDQLYRFSSLFSADGATGFCTISSIPAAAQSLMS